MCRLSATAGRSSLAVSIALVTLLAACFTRSDGVQTENPGDADGVSAILEAYQDKRSDVMVQASGIVERKLSDDTQFPRHQRFVLRIAPGHTVLVAHNIDLAARVPIEIGGRVRFYGAYEWNERGGVIHWTHDDPEGRRRGGWLEVDGRRYH